MRTATFEVPDEMDMDKIVLFAKLLDMRLVDFKDDIPKMDKQVVDDRITQHLSSPFVGVSIENIKKEYNEKYDL